MEVTDRSNNSSQGQSKKNILVGAMNALLTYGEEGTWLKSFGRLYSYLQWVILCLDT